jgi:hypothetical protein
LARRLLFSIFQFAKHDHGEQCHPAQNKERVVEAANELLGIGAIATGKKEDSYQSGAGVHTTQCKVSEVGTRNSAHFQ